MYLASAGPGAYKLICAHVTMRDYKCICVSLGRACGIRACLHYMVDSDVLRSLPKKGPHFHHIVNEYPSLPSLDRAGVEKQCWGTWPKTP